MNLYPIPRSRFPLRASDAVYLLPEEIEWLRQTYNRGGLIVKRTPQVEYHLVVEGYKLAFRQRGNSRRYSAADISAWRKKGLSWEWIARRYGRDRTTVWRAARRLGCDMGATMPAEMVAERIAKAKSPEQCERARCTG